MKDQLCKERTNRIDDVGTKELRVKENDSLPH